MIYTFMDNEEIKIEKIKDIHAIFVDNLLEFDTNEQLLSVMVAFYENKKLKILNYSEKDIYFDNLVFKLFNQYNIEKNNDIMMNETAKIFFNRKVTSNLEQKAIYNNRLIYNQFLELNNLSPIIEEVLKNIYAIFNTNYELNSITGYRDNFMLHSAKNKVSTTIPLTLKKIDDFNYNIMIGNIIENKTLNLEINFNKNGLLLNGTIDNIDFSISYNLSRQNNLESYWYLNKKLISYKNEQKEFRSNNIETLKKYLEMKDININEYQVFEIIKNQYVLIKTIQDLDALEEVIIYVSVSKLTTIQQYNTKKVQNKDNISIRIDGELKSSYIYDLGDCGIIEDYYLPLEYAKGNYKRIKANNYFYTLFTNDGIIKKYQIKEKIDESFISLNDIEIKKLIKELK